MSFFFFFFLSRYELKLLCILCYIAQTHRRKEKKGKKRTLTIIKERAGKKLWLYNIIMLSWRSNKKNRSAFFCLHAFLHFAVASFVCLFLYIHLFYGYRKKKRKKSRLSWRKKKIREASHRRKFEISSQKYYEGNVNK